MSRCINCLHYKACKGTYYTAKGCDNIALYDFDGEMYADSGCEDFTDRSEWVHLPFKLGDTVWFITGIHNTLIKSAKVEELSIDELGVSYIGVRTDNNIYFEKNTNHFHSTPEGAEKALEEKK